MAEKPEISVIIPVFNRRDSLKNAVKSVFSQTFTNYELIIVDDGSTDNILSALDTSRQSFRYIKIPHRGVSVARNVGIEHARGEWIAFLDSDDLWLPDKLQKQVKFSRANPEFLIHQTDEKWIKNGREIYPRAKHQKRSGDIFRYCLPLCIVSPSAVMIHRKVFEEVGKFDEFLPACEDYDFWLRTSLRFKIGLLKEKLIIKYGGHGDQLSERYWGMDRFRVKALEKLLRFKMDKSRRLLVIDEIITKLKILSEGRSKRRGRNTFEDKLHYYERIRSEIYNP